MIPVCGPIVIESSRCEPRGSPGAHALGRAASCVGAMAATLVETLDPSRIDVGCADDLPPPDFASTRGGP